MSGRRGQAALYLTDPQISLVLVAVNRLLIEMAEPDQGGFTGSEVATLERAQGELMRAQRTMPPKQRT
jgi:hypothetical protein